MQRTVGVFMMFVVVHMSRCGRATSARAATFGLVLAAAVQPPQRPEDVELGPGLLRSAGCMLFFLLSGRLPFIAATVKAPDLTLR